MDGEKKGTEFVIIPMEQFIELLDVRTRYKMLKGHVESVLDKYVKESRYSHAEYNDEFIAAVIDYKKGADDAEKADA